MARKILIQIRRGSENDLGALAAGELGYCTDTRKLFIGSSSGNVLLTSQQAAGDMLKSIYDTNNNGKVDAAEAADAVPWTGVTGKPGSFTPTVHTHTRSHITDFPASLPANGGDADTVDGRHAADFRLNQRYITSSTGSTEAGKWTRIGRCAISVQYQDMNVMLAVHDISHGSATTRRGLLFLRVKQQNAMGQAPGVELSWLENQGYSLGHFAAVVASNTSAETAVDLYMLQSQGYAQTCAEVVTLAGSGSFTGFSAAGYAASLPSGTQVLSVRPALTWGQLKGGS